MDKEKDFVEEQMTTQPIALALAKLEDVRKHDSSEYEPDDYRSEFKGHEGILYLLRHDAGNGEAEGIHFEFSDKIPDHIEPLEDERTSKLFVAGFGSSAILDMEWMCDESLWCVTTLHSYYAFKLIRHLPTDDEIEAFRDDGLMEFYIREAEKKAET